jgi:hypothetical protein
MAAAITAIVAAVLLCARLPPVRWVWRQLVSDPLSRWAGRLIHEGVQEFHLERVEPALAAIRKELTLNDGSTLRDEVVGTRRVAEEALGYVRRAAEG